MFDTNSDLYSFIPALTSPFLLSGSSPSVSSSAPPTFDDRLLGAPHSANSLRLDLSYENVYVTTLSIKSYTHFSAASRTITVKRTHRHSKLLSSRLMTLSRQCPRPLIQTSYTPPMRPHRNHIMPLLSLQDSIASATLQYPIHLPSLGIIYQCLYLHHTQAHKDLKAISLHRGLRSRMTASPTMTTTANSLSTDLAVLVQGLGLRAHGRLQEQARHLMKLQTRHAHHICVASKVHE
jgi:hypothetical protein